jgi:hypothetical protein
MLLITGELTLPLRMSCDVTDVVETFLCGGEGYRPCLGEERKHGTLILSDKKT